MELSKRKIAVLVKLAGYGKAVNPRALGASKKLLGELSDEGLVEFTMFETLISLTAEGRAALPEGK